MTGSLWTPEQDDALRRMVAAGGTSTRIGRSIGKSRSAVLGRMMRLGITGKSNYAQSRQAAAKARASRPKSNMPATVTKLDPKPDPVVPLPPRNLLLVDLNWSDCKWPVNSPPRGEAFLFCGHPREFPSSYCAHHRLVSTGAFTDEEAA